jgi:hypothetical protein
MNIPMSPTTMKSENPTESGKKKINPIYPNRAKPKRLALSPDDNFGFFIIIRGYFVADEMAS